MNGLNEEVPVWVSMLRCIVADSQKVKQMHVRRSGCLRYMHMNQVCGRLVYQLRNMSSQRLTSQLVIVQTNPLKGSHLSDIRRNVACT